MDDLRAGGKLPETEQVTACGTGTNERQTAGGADASLDGPNRARGTSRQKKQPGQGLPTWEHLSPAAQDAVIANQKLAKRLHKLGSLNYARSLQDCMTSAGAWCCKDCGAVTWHVNHCRQKLCAACGTQYAWARARIGRAITKRMKAPKFLTLTMRRVPRLKDGMRKLRRAIVRFRHLKFIRERVKSGFYVIEAKPKEDGWHVHAHCVIDAPYLPQAILSKAWARCVRQDYGVTDIRRISSARVARYVVKYCGKPPRLDSWTDGQLQEYVQALHNTRMLSKFGEAYAMELPECERQTDVAQLTCPACGRQGTMFPAKGAARTIGQDWRTWLGYALGRYPPVMPIDFGWLEP